MATEKEKNKVSVIWGMRVAKGMDVYHDMSAAWVVGHEGDVPIARFPTRVSVVWQWIEIALSNLIDCREAEQAFVKVVRSKGPTGNPDPLWECVAAGMQAVVATAFALDGIYAEIKERFPLPTELTTKWKDNKTARYAQISETIRRTFVISGVNAKDLRVMLREIFDLRDAAAHPKSALSYPIEFGTTGEFVDQTFAKFHFEKVKLVVGYGLQIIKLMANSKSKNQQVKEFALTNLKMVSDALTTWEKYFE